jgi:hypothetical protein
MPHRNLNKPACIWGHPFTEENTYLHRGKRLCRACRNSRKPTEHEKAYRKQWAKDNSESVKASSRASYQKNKSKWRLKSIPQQRNRYEFLRTEIISIFGGCCNSCSFSDPRALQIDHINGDGLHYKHDGKEYSHRGVFLYNKIIRGIFPKDDFQLLCANCNWIKRWEKGEMPKRIPLPE